MKRIEFGELRIGPIAREHINDCLSRNWISMGPKVELLEQEFAKIMGTRYAVALSSGTAALTAVTLSLRELAIKKVIPGKSKVICPALGFIANSTAIVSGGLIPKFVDIDPKTLNINPDLVRLAVEEDEDVVAIYAIGTMGCPADMEKLSRIAYQHNLVLFEDACENYGSKIKGEFSHTYAIGGCASLFQAHLVQAGEMGIVYTNDRKFKDLLVSIRSHGRPGKSAFFNHVRFGSNFKTTDLCASVGLEGVAHFHENIAARKKIWQSLVDITSKWKDVAWFSNEPKDVEVMPHGFSITVKPWTGLQIEDLEEIFDDEDVHWKKNFGAIFSHPAMSSFEYDHCPNALWCGENGIHIGCHRYMTDRDIERIEYCFKEFFK